VVTVDELSKLPLPKMSKLYTVWCMHCNACVCIVLVTAPQLYKSSLTACWLSIHNQCNIVALYACTRMACNAGDWY